VLRWPVAFTRWDPLQDLLALHERINRLAGSDEAGWMPPVDLYEAPDRYVVTAEVAGLAREDVQIHIQDGKLTLRGERPPHDPQSVRFERVERGHGRFTRTFLLPQPVDASAITADLDNGVLTIAIPKLFDRRRVEIEQG
jgi:HSP20 family protein